jgi:hypothetical protein
MLRLDKVIHVCARGWFHKDDCILMTRNDVPIR